MDSLFHENKQMGLVLKRAFRGNHCWIHPIPKQVEDAKKQGLSDEEIQKRCIQYDKAIHASNMEKIDAMFFACTEEPLVLKKTDEEAL